MDDQYERQARQLHSELDGLREERDTRRRAADRTITTLGGVPRLRDRNKFFSWLLNGELAVLERTSPLWLEFKRLSGEVDRLEGQLADKRAEFTSAVRRGLEAGDPAYRALVAEADRERTAKRSVNQLLGAIHRAQEKIGQASRRPRDEESSAAANRDVGEVNERIYAVRKHVIDVNEKISSRHSFNSNDAVNLDPDLSLGSAGHNATDRNYKNAMALLRSLESRAGSLLRDVEKRERSLESRQRDYVERECARFTESIE